MAFTRAQVENMDEAKLRTDVLIPLFKAMKYQDVQLYHGLSGEQGKDIVMWKPDELRERVNYAVVAKKKSINGQVNGKGSAGEVFIQVRQTLGSTFRDSTTLESQKVDVCLVVTSSRITKEAHDSIDNMLRGTSGEARVMFIDGDKLWGLVEKYLPASAALQKLDDVGNHFETVSDHHRITAKVSGKNVVLSTEPKHPAAYRDEPLEFKMKLSFDKQPENQKALADVQQFLKAGAPVTLPNSVISSLEVPEILKPLLGDLTLAAIELGPRKLRNPVTATLRITATGDEPVVLEGIVLEGTVGEEQVTLQNSAQRIPWHFEFLVNTKTQDFGFSYDFTQSQNQNVAVHVRRWQLLNALSKGGLLEVTDAMTGLTFVSARFPTGVAPPPNQAELSLLQVVLSIQTMTKTPISIPLKSITNDEIVTALHTEGGIRTGIVIVRSASAFADVERRVADAIVSHSPDAGSYQIELSETSPVFVFGTEVPVGPRQTTVTGIRFSDAEKARLVQVLSEQPDEDNIRVNFEGEDGGLVATIRYLNWTPPVSDGA
ncbi:MAG: restriction endonuclease [Gemmatimonadaceae bacterium]|nr:restriction endonuclease [Gemmatimonadaceae bacterium]